MNGVDTAADLRTTGRERAALVLLYLFSAVALLGFATFGVNPTLLNRVPAAAWIYGPAFQFFSQGQIVLAFTVLAAVLWARTGVRWLSAFLALYLISLGSELLGTGTGVPFGPYRYTEALGPRWFGHVPVLIPLSWFFMAVPSYAIARRAAAGSVAGTILLASFVLLAWDLSLDPAMSRATAYWVWETEGAYYGMPLLNLLGWYVTGIALMAALAGLRAWRWVDGVPPRWLVLFYGANLLLPVGMSAARGMWGAVLATGAALGVYLAAVRLAGGRATLSRAVPA